MQVFMDTHKDRLDHGLPVTWHTDNGGEFLSSDVDEFCKEFAIKRSYSVPYAPPQNAHAERIWGILLKTIRTTLAHSALPDKYWVYAIENAAQLHNAMPSLKLDGQVSPHEALYQVKPDVSRFRVFGCLCWYLLPEHERRSKVSPRSVPAINLGCDPQRKGHIIYIPATGKVTTAYHLTFQESSFIPLTPDGDAVLPPASNALGDHVPLYMERRDVQSSRSTPPRLTVPSFLPRRSSAPPPPRGSVTLPPVPEEWNLPPLRAVPPSQSVPPPRLYLMV